MIILLNRLIVFIIINLQYFIDRSDILIGHIGFNAFDHAIHVAYRASNYFFWGFLITFNNRINIYFKE
jgi:hypothetical protein